MAHQNRVIDQLIARNRRLNEEEALQEEHPVLEKYTYSCHQCGEERSKIGYIFTGLNVNSKPIHFCNINCAQEWETWILQQACTGAAEAGEAGISDRRAAVEATKKGKMNEIDSALRNLEKAFRYACDYGYSTYDLEREYRALLGHKHAMGKAYITPPSPLGRRRDFNTPPTPDRRAAVMHTRAKASS